MKYIILLLIIASLAACKKDDTTPASKYRTWFMEMNGGLFFIYLGDSSHYASFVSCGHTCSSFCGNLYNVKVGDSIVAWTGDNRCGAPYYRQSATIGAIRNDGSRIIFQTDTAPSTAATVVQVSYIVKE